MSSPLYGNYGIFERLFRTCVFQLGVKDQGIIERLFVYLFSPNNGEGCFNKGFNKERARQTVEIFENLGADVRFVSVDKGFAHVQMAHFKASDFEELIEQEGGSWERVTTANGEELFTIIPPEELTEGWEKLEEGFKKLKWPEKELVLEGDSAKTRLFVTSLHADIVPEEDQPPQLFLHTPSPSVSFCMTGRRIGFFLGCKQDVLVYDPPGVFDSTGTPSEALNYDAAYAVYNHIKDDYDTSNIWVTGACGGNFAAAYLKKELHDEGVNFIHERGAWNLKEDFIDPLGWVQRKYANWKFEALKKRGMNDTATQEVGFNIEALWQDLNYSEDGRIIVINIKNDEYLSSDTTLKHLETAKKVNASVTHVSFSSSKKDNPHFDMFFKYETPSKEVLTAIFQDLDAEEEED